MTCKLTSPIDILRTELIGKYLKSIITYDYEKIIFDDPPIITNVIFEYDVDYSICIRYREKGKSSDSYTSTKFNLPIEYETLE